MFDPTEPAAGSPDEARLGELMEMIVALASNDFTKRATVGAGADLLDGIATGLNMLAEEVEKQHRLEQTHVLQIAHANRLAAVGQLAASVAHEINNPAAFVLANLTALGDTLVSLESLVTALHAEAARTGGATEVSALLARAGADALLAEARRLTAENITGIERIADTVKELRTFARAEPELVEALDLARILDDACKLTRRQIAYRARLVIRTPPDLPPVRGVRPRLVQVFTNLILYASQTIDEGASERNEIEVTARPEHGGVVVTVRDTGRGLTREEQARLFTPFYASGPGARDHGLGLSISANLLQRHGGELRVESVLGVGSTFEVRLPLTEPLASRPARGSAPVLSGAPRRRVLLVDDEALLLNAYRRMLAAQYSLGFAASGREAIEVLERDATWDAIICDLMMPGIDGIALSEWIAAHRPELEPRTLFCSGARGFTPRTQAFADELGPRLLDKPMTREQLVNAIERVAPRSTVGCG